MTLDCAQEFKEQSYDGLDFSFQHLRSAFHCR